MGEFKLLKKGDCGVLFIDTDGGHVPMSTYQLVSVAKECGWLFVTIGGSQVISAGFDLFLLGERRILLNAVCVRRHDAPVPYNGSPEVQLKARRHNEYWNAIGAQQLGIESKDYRIKIPDYRCMKDEEMLELKIAHVILNDPKIAVWRDLPQKHFVR